MDSIHALISSKTRIEILRILVLNPESAFHINELSRQTGFSPRGVEKERIPERFGFDAVDDIQVLTPMHKGVVGAGNLNVELQSTLNPGQGGVMRGNRNYRLNDKVMQIKNNYDKEVFNGDIGRITRIDQEARKVTISFDGRDRAYDYTDLDEIILAYAVSVHKSQGSDYHAVIIPIVTQHYILLQRNLMALVQLNRYRI
jgi:exodeoxyribonuclease V alpha subunit